MTYEPLHDLVATNPDGTQFGYFIYPQAQSPLSVAVKRPQLTGGVVDYPADAGGSYSVRDQEQPALVFTDWSRGAGQESYESQDAHSASFHSSEGIDTHVKGEMRLSRSASLTADTAVEGVTLSALGKVWMAFTPAAADPRNGVRYWDGSAWQPVTYTGTDPASSVVAFATDGEYLYVVHGGSDGIWRVKDLDADGVFTDESLAQWSTAASITKLCFSGGYMYAAKADSAGYLDEAQAYNQLSPTAIGASLSTVGLATASNWVYWATQKEGVSKLYRMQFDGTNEWFEDVCDFPSGFVATSLVGYLNYVFVGGYYECTTSNVGQGAVYMVAEGTPTLLTVIGQNPDDTEVPAAVENDNRIRAMVAAEKDLYILANRSVFRWDLDDSGYTHVADVPQGTSSMAWTTTGDLDYTATALPDAGTWTKTGTGTAAVTNGILAITCDTGESLDYTATLTGGDLLDNAQGWTLEGYLSVCGSGGYVNVCDGTYETRLKMVSNAPGIAGSQHQLIYLGEWTGSEWIYVRLSELDDAGQNVYRLIVENKWAALYINGTLAGTSVALKTSTDNTISFGGLDPGSPSVWQENYFKIDYLYHSNDGAFSPGAEYAPSTLGGIAFKNSGCYVGINGVGYVMTSDAYATEGWLRQSVSSSRSGSLQKQYHQIVVSHEPLGVDESLTCDYYLDGKFTGGPAGVTSGTQTTFALSAVGRNIAPVIYLNGAGASTPRIHSVTVTYDFKRYRTHTYVLDCRRGANGGRWRYNPEDAINHLLNMVDTGGTFEARLGGSYEGVVQELEFLEANRSTKGGIEGIVSVAVREIE